MTDAPFHMPDELVIELPICPTTNNLFASDGLRRFKSSQYKVWIKEAGWILAAQRPPQLTGKVSLLIEIAEPPTKRLQDCSNRIKAVEDLLVTHKIIPGDDQRYVREVTARWAPVNGLKITIRSAA